MKRGPVDVITYDAEEVAVSSDSLEKSFIKKKLNCYHEANIMILDALLIINKVNRLSVKIFELLADQFRLSCNPRASDISL